MNVDANALTKELSEQRDLLGSRAAMCAGALAAVSAERDKLAAENVALKKRVAELEVKPEAVEE